MKKEAKTFIIPKKNAFIGGLIICILYTLLFTHIITYFTLHINLSSDNISAFKLASLLFPVVFVLNCTFLIGFIAFIVEDKKKKK